jgi:hypothetical protein
MPVNNSPNMNLPIPVVGQEAGPQYAVDMDNSLTLIDQHNHSPGQGVLITPSGLNINIDLSFNGNSAAALFACKFTPQSSTQPSSLTSALYTVINPTYGSDLYFNDGNGAAIPVVLNGVIAGTPGSISGLVAPASATYTSVSGTFTWQSAVNTPASLDSGPITVRDATANSYGVTIEPNSGISSNYQITLPTALPSAQKFVTLDNSGNLLANWVPDNSTIVVSGNQVQVGTLATGSITGTQIASATITSTNVAATPYGVDLINSFVGTSLSGGISLANPQGRPVLLAFNAYFIAINAQTTLTIARTSPNPTTIASFTFDIYEQVMPTIIDYAPGTTVSAATYTWALSSASNFSFSGGNWVGVPLL